MTPLLFLVAALAPVVIALEPGQQSTLAVSGEALSVGPPAAAPLSDFDHDAVERLRADGCRADNCGPNSKPVMADDVSHPRSHAAPNTIRITFGDMDGNAVLALDNGTDKALSYHARITVRGRTGSTDVCQVLPGKGGVEHWPYRIERIELTAFRLDPWDDAMTPRCE